jgi:aspartate dehydrogenase
MQRVGIIGQGAIGRAIIEAWSDAAGLLTAVLVRPYQVKDAAARAGDGVVVTSGVDAFLAARPEVVIEAAGHGAVADYAEPILEAGCELHVLSAGALGRDALRTRLEGAAARGGGRIVIPAGAFAGFDGLRSLRAAGLGSVRFTSIKPPHAWRDTPAETLADLDALQSPFAFFTGGARDAAQRFPKNANLAAAVALAGIGFERTEVVLIADPSASGNRSRIEAVSDAGILDVTLNGAAFADNPRSSRITAASALAALVARRAPIVFA